MRVIVIGSAGMLGHKLVKAFSKNHQVLAVDKDEMDITDLEQVRSQTAEFKPSWLVNAAAFTAVDLAESQEDEAFLINAVGSRNISVASYEAGARVLYFSTDYVFDGASGSSYREWDSPAPINAYGRSKLAGEKWVRSHNPRHLIVRTSWLFGERGPNFVDKIAEAARSGKDLKVVSDQVGSPTYTSDLAELSVNLTEQKRCGTYHITNSGSCSWFELAKEIVRVLELDVTVTPVPTSHFPLPARRPSCSVLSNETARKDRIPRLRPWEEAVAAHLSQRNA